MGIITDSLVRGVLDNVAVHDIGLVHLRVIVFNDGGQQLSEDLDEVTQHGRYTRDAGPATWWRLLVLSRRLGLVRAAVVFDMTRQLLLPQVPSPSPLTWSSSLLELWQSTRVIDWACTV